MVDSGYMVATWHTSPTAPLMAYTASGCRNLQCAAPLSTVLLLLLLLLLQHGMHSAFGVRSGCPPRTGEASAAAVRTNART